MEAVVGRARATRHPWLVALVANVNPEFFLKKSLSLKEICMCIEAPETRISTCRSTVPKRRVEREGV